MTQLDGVAVGTVLASDATIPTKNKWETDGFVGISLDISVATRLFFSMFKPAP